MASSALRSKKKNKGGRPRLAKNSLAKTITVSVTEAEYEMFYVVAKALSLSGSEVFRKILHKSLSTLL